jgi:hypothetical protein
MGKCLKGKSEVKEKAATYRCKHCGALTDKKGHLCDPKKVKEEDKGKKGKKKK